MLMLNYPINVKPQNRAIDMNDPNHITYVFQGDILSGVMYRVINYDTGEVEFETIYQNQDKTPIGYNGYQISQPLATSGLRNSRRYILQMMLVQRTASGADPICDMPVIGGKIERDTSLSNTIYVSKGITSIYPWGKSGDTYSPISVDAVLFNPMKIRIGNVTKTIMSYTDNIEIGGETYGMISLDSSVSVSAGDTYQIYSNAIISPQYFFKCENKPSVTLSNTNYANRINVTGSYIQARNIPIKYYVLRLWWSNTQSFSPTSLNGKVELVSETNKIYSQNIEYSFWNAYRHDENYPSGTTDYYKIECDVVTQDDYTLTVTKNFSIVPSDYSETLGNILYEYTLSWDRENGRVLHYLRGYSSGGIGVSGTFELFRKDLRSGEEVKLQPHHFKTIEYATLVGYDITASTKGSYQYTLKKFDDNGGVIIPVLDPEYSGIGTFPSNVIDISENAYYITALIPHQVNDAIYHPNSDGDLKPEFEIGETWKFVGEISDTTVTNNLDTMTHVGYGRYINTTSTDVNYMSGTLSAMIGYVNCAERKYIDDIALVQAWRKFITSKNPFLLKSQKGDVWVVEITENPSTTYDESHSSIPTTFSFSWAEICNVNDIELYDRNVTQGG